MILSHDELKKILCKCCCHCIQLPMYTAAIGHLGNQMHTRHIGENVLPGAINYIHSINIGLGHWHLLPFTLLQQGTKTMKITPHACIFLLMTFVKLQRKKEITGQEQLWNPQIKIWRLWPSTWNCQAQHTISVDVPLTAASSAEIRWW